MIILLRNKKHLLTLAVVILVAFSWTSALDTYADRYTDGSILQAGTAYATARGINAMVSILQTSTVQVGIGFSGSITVGEIFDPINDLIERFSNIMTFALGSLVLQKILILIANHTFFKILITLFGTAYIAILWAGKFRATSFLWTIFVLLIFIRFSLGIVVSLNSMVDNAFLSEDIETRTIKLDKFKQDVSSIKNKDITGQEYLQGILLNLEQDKKSLEAQQSKLVIAEGELKTLKQQLDKLNEALEGDFSLTCRLNPFCDELGFEKAKADISNLKTTIKTKEGQIKDIKNLIDELKSNIREKEKKLNGEDLKARITKMLPDFNKWPSQESIANTVSENINNIIRLLVLFILKTILIPLIFLYAFIRIIKKYIGCSGKFFCGRKVNPR